MNQEEHKWLGKISHVNVGFGGYQGSQFGISFTLEGEYGVGDFWGGWGPDITWSKNCQWTEADRQTDISKAFWRLALLMQEAKVDDANKLVGIPVEITSNGRMGGTLKSWRILTEVL